MSKNMIKNTILFAIAIIPLIFFCFNKMEANKIGDILLNGVIFYSALYIVAHGIKDNAAKTEN